jgi:AcrR family transcriptional regulator
MTTAGRPLRADAQRNRQRLLQAAHELFAERGLSVTLDDIAHRAGVGVGTAYRRFGSRDELVTALFEERMQEILSLADQALEIEDPWEALVTFLTRMAELQASDRGLKEVMLGSVEGRERVARLRDQLRPRGEALVARAKTAGMLRPDFDVSDVPLLQMMVAAIADVAPPARPDLWRRCLALLIDGIRAPGVPRGPLPSPPLGLDFVEEVMVRWRPPRAGPKK